jgi:hypothetical protein
MRQDADWQRATRPPALDDVRISKRVGVCGRVRVLSLPTTYLLYLSTHAEAHSSCLALFFPLSFLSSIFYRGSLTIFSSFYSLGFPPIRSLNNLGP